MLFSFLLLPIFLLIFSKGIAFAESDYVLPYPSFMPGSKFYTVHLIYECLSKYWHFGNFSKFKYHLKLSDNYLVEAKILFEYKQYLFAYKAIEKSDKNFQEALICLKSAKKEGKIISEKLTLFKSASKKHVVVLEEVKVNSPQTFHWQSEDSSATDLKIQDMIDKSIQLRLGIL